MKKLVLIICLSMPFCAVALAVPESASLDTLAQELKEKNPRIQAAFHKWKEATYAVSPTGTWPNPNVGYSEEKESGFDGMKMKNFSVAQEIPFPGKLSQEKSMKWHESMIAHAAYQDVLLEMLGELRLRYYQLYLTDELIHLTGESVQTFKQALVATKARVGSGASSASDALMAQAELARMEALLVEQQQARRGIEIELNALFAKSGDTSWGKTNLPALKPLPYTGTELEQLAQTYSPWYVTALHESKHGSVMLRRAQWGWAPDIEVMAKRQVPEEGPNGREVGVSLNIPLWISRPWNNVKSARAHRDAAQASAEEMKQMVLKMVRMEALETDTHLQMATRYKNLILPPMTANLSLARDQYASGKIDFLRLLESVRSWLESHVEYQNQLYHYAEHWSLLERWIGREVSNEK